MVSQHDNKSCALTVMYTDIGRYVVSEYACV